MVGNNVVIWIIGFLNYWLVKAMVRLRSNSCIFFFMFVLEVISNSITSCWLGTLGLFQFHELFKITPFWGYFLWLFQLFFEGVCLLWVKLSSVIDHSLKFLFPYSLFEFLKDLFGLFLHYWPLPVDIMRQVLKELFIDVCQLISL